MMLPVMFPLTWATQMKLMEIWCGWWLPRQAQIIDFNGRGRAP